MWIAAAAMAYGLHRKPNINYVIVYDWGGGTLDIALLWIKEGNVQLLSSDGDRDFGGANIDQCLFDFLKTKFLQTMPSAHRMFYCPLPRKRK